MSEDHTEGSVVGRRRFLAGVVGASVALAGCGDVAGVDHEVETEVDLGAVEGPAEWRTRGGDPANTGAATEVPAEPLEVAWTANLEGHTGSPTPVVGDGLVFTTNHSGTVYAFDADSGEVVWTATLGDERVRLPAALGEAVLVTAGGEDVVGLDRETGKRRFVAAHGEGRNLSVGPRIADGVVIFPTRRSVHGFDAADGDRLWTVESGLSPDVEPAIRDGVAYVGGDDTVLRALALEDGRELWRTDTDVRHDQVAATPDRVLVLGVSPWDEVHLLAFDREDGSRLLDRTFEGGRARALAVVDGYAFVGTDRLSVVRLSDDTRCWHNGAFGGGYHSGIVVDDERVYAPVGGDGSRFDDRIGAFDVADGELLGRFGGGRLYNGPAVGDDALYAAGVPDELGFAKLVPE